MVAGIVIGGAVGLVVGVVAGLAIGRRGLVAAEARVRSSDARASEADARSREAELAAVRFSEQLEAQRRAQEEHERSAEEVRRQLLGEFASLSQQALQANNEQFLTLAHTKLAEASQSAGSDLAQRQQAIESLVRPLRDELDRYGNQVQQLELHRVDAYRKLTDHLQTLRDGHERLERETRNLAGALRSPATRGRWGELQLRKVVEMAGMLEHCDFDVQVSTGSDGARMRPDLVVHLPGSKHVVVDAKVPLDAFQSAIGAETEEERRLAFQHHARQVRAHVDALAKKEYWRQVEPSPEFVVAFVPGDPLLAAAFEHDPGLIEHAMANHVLPATPTTLISLLWAVAYSWQQDALADNAREVQRLGTELYQRLSKLGEHLAKLGRSLTSSVEAYNSAVGSFESRVLVTARRFPELGVGSAEHSIGEMEPVVSSARVPQAAELQPAEEVSPTLSGVSVLGEDPGDPVVEQLSDGLAQVAQGL